MSKGFLAAAVAACVAFGWGTGRAAADEPLGETGCVHRDTNGMVTLVICPPGLPVEALGEAGDAACGDRRPCAAWIWDDAAVVPAAAPDTHEALGAETIAAAVAIWVAEDKSLITLEALRD
jgi:hypothetical protein